MLKDTSITFDEPIVIHCDNTNTINMSKNLVLHSKTEHVSIKYQFLRKSGREKSKIGICKL